MMLALASMIMAAAEPAPNWRLYDRPGGRAWLDTNSVLDNGTYRSVLYRTDPPQHEVHFVSRMEVDCARRSMRMRTAAAYDLRWRELLTHRLPAGQFFSPSDVGWLVDAACNSPAVRRDPVPADAPSTYSVATEVICEQARAERAHGLPDWLDQILMAVALGDADRAEIAQSCAALDQGPPEAGH